MRIWHLEKEYDAFIAAVISAREERKAGVRDTVARIRAEVLEKGEAALWPVPGSSTDGPEDYPLQGEPGRARSCRIHPRNGRRCARSRA